MKRRDGMPYCKIVDCGRIVKRKLYSDYSAGCQVTYLPKGTKVFRTNGEEIVLEQGQRHYVDKDGIIRQTRVSKKKGDNIDSIKRSFARLRDLINANAQVPDRVLFVTMTYDPKKLRSELTLKKVSNDMGNAFRRMKKRYTFEYIYTVEKQGNGRWHQHCLLFFDEKAPYLEQKYLEWVWQAGFVKVSKRFDDTEIANIGAYVCADMTYGENKDEHGRIKNERLMGYDAGAHLYRCSKGVKRPVEYSVDYEQSQKVVSGLGEPIYVMEKKTVNPHNVADVRHYRYEHFLNIDALE